MVIGGMLGIAVLVMTVTGGGVWWFYLRQGAVYGVRPSLTSPTLVLSSLALSS